MSLSNILYTIILYPLVQIIEISYKLFDKLFSTSGFSVIGVSLTVTLLCLPLYIVAEHWQKVERDTQTKLKPGIDRIKSTFKGDEQYMILNTFYKQNHYHPMMALRSSFGLLIQIPFFMAAYSCLSNMPDLQGQSFLFIKDMGQQDALFMIGSFPVNILPIAMTLINIIAGAIYTKGFPIKEKLQIYGMALLFLVVLYGSPSGLVLYWTMNNVFSLVKNIFYKLKHPVWTLYILMTIGLLGTVVFVLFIYSGGASTIKRLSASLPLLLCLPLPLYLKFINYLIDTKFVRLRDSKKERHLLFIISSIGCLLITGFLLPSSLIASSVQEFSNIGSFGCPTSFVFSTFWQSFGIFIFWAFCIYFLFNNRVQTIISVLFTIGLFLGLVNSFIFTGDYGSMDVTLKFLDGIKEQSKLFILINLIVSLLAIIAIFLSFVLKKESWLKSIISVLCLVFVVLGIKNSIQIKSEYNEFQEILSKKENIDSDFSTKFHLSKTEKNVVVFMLDRAESAFFQEIYDNNIAIKEQFSGFTYYPNTLSANGHTLMGSPGLYGGYEYTPSEMNKTPNKTLKEKHNEALLLMPRIFSEQANYKVACSDLSWGNYSYVSDMSFTKAYEKINGMNLYGRYSAEFKKEYLSDEQSNNLSETVNRNLIWISFFRQSLAIIRPAIYYKGSWWASETAENFDLFIDLISELKYLPNLTDFTSNSGTFSLITNDVTHENFDLSSNIKLIDKEKINSIYKNDNAYEIQVLALELIADWFKYLKENNCYDNTKIIIVSDHGIGNRGFDKYDNPFLENYDKDHLNPILLVKDFNATGELKIDNTFMTNADVPTLALKDIVQNPKNPFTGKNINSESKKDGFLVTTSEIFMPYQSKNEYIFTTDQNSWYRVKDNIFIDSNWKKEIVK